MSWKAFITSGLAGMMLDLDHLVSAFKHWVPLSNLWHYMTTQGTREFHIFGLWASFMVFLYFWINEEQDG